MSETPTPRTDAELYLPCGDDMVPSQRVGWVAASTARQLERELAAALKQIDQLSTSLQEMTEDRDEVVRVSREQLSAANEAREYALGQLTQCTEMLAAAEDARDAATARAERAEAALRQRDEWLERINAIMWESWCIAPRQPIPGEKIMSVLEAWAAAGAAEKE